MAPNRVECIMSMQSPLTAAEAVSDDGDFVQRVLVLFDQVVDSLLRVADVLPEALRVQLLEAYMTHEVLKTVARSGWDIGKPELLYFIV